jgi:hypothetical protein
MVEDLTTHGITHAGNFIPLQFFSTKPNSSNETMPNVNKPKKESDIVKPAEALRQSGIEILRSSFNTLESNTSPVLIKSKQLPIKLMSLN